MQLSSKNCISVPKVCFAEHTQPPSFLIPTTITSGGSRGHPTPPPPTHTHTHPHTQTKIFLFHAVFFGKIGKIRCCPAPSHRPRGMLDPPLITTIDWHLPVHSVLSCRPPVERVAPGVLSSWGRRWPSRCGPSSTASAGDSSRDDSWVSPWSPRSWAPGSSLLSDPSALPSETKEFNLKLWEKFNV